ncbi:hypothetical protein HN592_00965 [Candidatus Woesearchaeota archaeon]|nr:hypothetical protein [Candidatus Woesearchaeota archaeon]MBT4368875.1 hypothetical protein [Candidatus Woesearchaeota archaeon]MBT4712164.1 hypothetical protein [Candidatus Woesearchaeota archaeon]MBT6639088.1 hypothetical protein [Candidatus Woesearchaeota archaeon]MBT7134288.1 hypothetical protein [Candidatus Woesearchaeota archaeon]
MNLDKILHLIQILSLVSLMINVFFMVTTPDILKYVMFSVLSIYLFMATSWINHARKNNVNNSTITKQVAGVVLGTIILIIIITALFKLVTVLQAV